MCLGLPGQVVEWIERDPLMATAKVSFGAVKKVCQMACVPDAREGDYVIVHAGIALTVIDQKAAEELLLSLQQLERSPSDSSTDES